MQRTHRCAVIFGSQQEITMPSTQVETRTT